MLMLSFCRQTVFSMWKKDNTGFFFTVRIVYGLWNFIRIWEAAFISFFFPEESESCICHDLANWDFDFVWVCESFVLFLTHVLKAGTETVLTVIWIPACWNTCTLLLPHLQVFNDIVWKRLQQKLSSVLCPISILESSTICWLRHCKEAENVDSAFSFNQTGIL